MNLYSYYRINFDLSYYHKFSLSEVEKMIPFERDIYIDMILIDKEKEKNELNNQKGINNNLPDKEGLFP